MALLTATTPKPSLALVVNDARAVKRAEKSAARPLRRWARRLTVGLAMTFALLGFSGGTAQAWPWDVAENITAFITNFCGPQDVPPLANYTGTDTTFGLNSVENSTVRNTIVADPGSLSSVAGKEGNGLERLQTAFGSDKTLTSPTYERYGFTSLAWTNFGSGCFSIGYWFSPISNLAFTLAVKFPMIVGMALLHLAMDNWLYDVFTTIISPFVKVFTTIFTPWVYFIAPIGVLWVWIKSRGSVQQVMKAAVWVLCIFGVFLWMGNNTSTLVTKANNFVTVFAGAAAEKISTAATGTATPADNPLGAIDQALWHGVPYQAWLVGEVGDAEAGADIEREKAGQLGWGPAILNGLYVGTDEKARDVEANRQDWNGRSYSPDASDDSKTGSWTGNGGEKSWQGIPLLTVVKFMCNDSADGGENSGDEADNRWFYGGQCDAAGAGTTQMVGHFTGATYNEQLVSAFAGGYATLAVVLAIGLCSIYLALQKMLFYFLLLFGPIFLAVSLFADDKRRAFAKRYFELLLANIIKQCVAVCVVLFVAFSISNLLYPPPSVGLPEIPWMLKPSVAMLFFIALVLFLIPLRNILTAAAKGDTKVVDQTANAPVVAAKGAAKVAVVATAAVATGGAALAFSGTSLGAAAMAGGKVGKAGQLLTTASRVVGSRGGVGKALRVMGQGANLGQQVGTSQLDKQGRADAVLQGAKGLISDNPGKYQTDSNGKVTKEGLAAAKKDFTKDAQIGTAAVRSAAAFNATQAAANEGFLKRTGSYSPSDPRNPDNIKLAAIAKEGDRLDTLEQVKNARARTDNSDGPIGGGPVVGGGDSPAVANSEFLQARYARRAQDLMEMPRFARNEDIKATVTASGADLLAGMDSTQSQAAANPAMLLTGQAYSGGNTTAMDPRHPATAALTELRFAAANGSEQDRQVALMKASQAIGTHGVPDEVSAIRTTGSTAAQFQGVNVVGAMKTVTDSTPWEERASAATTMQAAVVQMPADHPAADKMQAYVNALSSPTVPANEVEALRAQAVDGVGAASAGLTPQAYATLSAYQAAKANPATPAAELQPLETAAAAAVLNPESINPLYADDSAAQINSWANATAGQGSSPAESDGVPVLAAAQRPTVMAGADARQSRGAASSDQPSADQADVASSQSASTRGSAQQAAEPSNGGASTSPFAGPDDTPGSSPSNTTPAQWQDEGTFSAPPSNNSQASHPATVEPPTSAAAPGPADYSAPATPAAGAAVAGSTFAEAVSDQPEPPRAEPVSSRGDSYSDYPPAAQATPAGPSDEPGRRDDTPAAAEPSTDRHHGDRRVDDSQGWDLDGYGAGQTTAAAAGFRGENDRHNDRPISAEALMAPVAGAALDGGRDRGVDRADLREALREVREEDSHLRPGDAAPAFPADTQSASAEAAPAADGGVIAEGVAARQMRTSGAPAAPTGPAETAVGPEEQDKQEDESRRVFRPTRRRRITGLFGGPTEQDANTDDRDDRGER